MPGHLWEKRNGKGLPLGKGTLRFLGTAHTPKGKKPDGPFHQNASRRGVVRYCRGRYENCRLLFYVP